MSEDTPHKYAVEITTEDQDYVDFSMRAVELRGSILFSRDMLKDKTCMDEFIPSLLDDLRERFEEKITEKVEELSSGDTTSEE